MKRRQAQLEARRVAILNAAAIKVQRAFRGHKGRHDATLLRQWRHLQRVQAAKELAAARLVQRIYRGHSGRHDYWQRLQIVLEDRERQRRATQMQGSYRRHLERKRAKAREKAEEEAKMLRAVVRIQKNWRGLRERHLATIMLGLVYLRRREDRAARTIQNKIRGYLSRSLIKAMKAVHEANIKRDTSATDIQRMFRGHRGRAFVEVVRALRKLETQAKPLYLRIAKYEASIDELSSAVETLRAQVTAEIADEKALSEELEKTMTIKSKFHDSARITGAKQRFLTRFLQTQLVEQLQQKRALIAVEERNLEVLVAELQESQKQLRFATRELQPLTDGVELKTRRERTLRLQNKVRNERFASITIQRYFRGYRVRAAVAEGANRWLELFDPSSKQMYYYNAWSQETRRAKPLAMGIFGDTFVARYKDTTWYQCLDEVTRQFYFYNAESHEYRWEAPEVASARQSSRSNTHVSSRPDHDKHIFERLTMEQRSAAPTTRQLGDWQEHMDPETNVSFYYHPATGESVWSLPPKVAHHASLSSSGRRSVRSLNDRPEAETPVAWQYYYGYEVTPRGELIKRTSPRSAWIEAFDTTTELPYYYNQLTHEYRWTKPDDFMTPVEIRQESSGQAWFKQQDPEALTARSIIKQNKNNNDDNPSSSSVCKTREIGLFWQEMLDIATGHRYYFNRTTGETRWSLSPRTARDEGVSTHMPLTLQSKLAAWKASSTPYVAYPERAMHMAWLQDALLAKDWAKAEGLVHEIESRDVNVSKPFGPPSHDLNVRSAADKDINDSLSEYTMADLPTATPSMEEDLEWQPMTCEATGNLDYVNCKTLET